MVTLTIASRVYFFSYVLCVRASFFTIVPLHFTHLFALFFLSYRFLYFLNDWVPVFRFGLPLLCASAVRLLCHCCLVSRDKPDRDTNCSVPPGRIVCIMQNPLFTRLKFAKDRSLGFRKKPTFISISLYIYIGLGTCGSVMHCCTTHSTSNGSVQL